MRTQTELTIILGAETLPDAFRDDVITKACHYSGGCTVLDGAGYWHEDGDKHLDRYQSKLATEETLIVKLTCENHKLEAVYSSLRDNIAMLVKVHGLAVDWVHVQQSEIVGRHFSVKALHEEAIKGHGG